MNSRIINTLRQVGVVLFAVAILAGFALLFYRAGIAYAFNADAHYLPNVLDHLGGANEEIYLPGHTFANKIPFVLLVLRILGNTYPYYSLLNLVFGFGWLIPIAAIVFAFQRRDRSLPIRLLVFTVPLMTSTYFFMVTSSATMRNAEHGLAYVMFFLAVRYVTSDKPGWRKWALPALALLTYSLIVSDEFFLTGFVLPIVGLGSLLWLRRGSDGPNQMWRRGLRVSIVTVVSAALALLTLAFFKTWPQSPIHIAPNSDFLMNTYQGLARSVDLATRGTLDFLGAEFWGRSLSVSTIAQGLTVLMGLLALAGALRLLFHAVARYGGTNARLPARTSKELFLLLVTASFVLTCAAYVGTNFAGDPTSTRYLNVLPIFVGTFCALAPRFPYRKTFSRLTLVACLPILIINFTRVEENLERFAPRMDYYDALSTLIEQDNLKVGYSGYWNSFSTSFLTKADDVIIPVSDCAPWPYIGTKSLFSMPPDFILIDRNGIDKVFWVNCSDAQLVTLYGPPTSTKTLRKGNETIEMWILK